MSRNRRNLSSDEIALWDLVTRNVKRFASRTSSVPSPDPSPSAPHKAQPIAQMSKPPPIAPLPQRTLELGSSEGLDRRTAQRFARGRMDIDARLDLHGMSLSQAEAEVTRFIRAAAAADYRCVLVVTGKGRRKADTPSAIFDDEGPRGRIRAEAPHWLNRPSLRPLILAVREAHFRHGGGGALYVLLKRRRTGA